MSENTISSCGLACSCEQEQDVTHSSPLISLSEALIQMAKSMVKYKMQFLKSLPQDEVMGENRVCKCYPMIACKDWAMDEDLVRSLVTDIEHQDLELANEYILEIIRDGPLGVHCIWIEGGRCVKGEI